jgi:hypothetical protein
MSRFVDTNEQVRDTALFDSKNGSNAPFVLVPRSTQEVVQGWVYDETGVLWDDRKGVPVDVFFVEIGKWQTGSADSPYRTTASDVERGLFNGDIEITATTGLYRPRKANKVTRQGSPSSGPASTVIQTLPAHSGFMVFCDGRPVDPDVAKFLLGKITQAAYRVTSEQFGWEMGVARRDMESTKNLHAKWTDKTEPLLPLPRRKPVRKYSAIIAELLAIPLEEVLKFVKIDSAEDVPMSSECQTSPVVALKYANVVKQAKPYTAQAARLIRDLTYGMARGKF